jgi:hypothetical protein
VTTAKWLFVPAPTGVAATDTANAIKALSAAVPGSSVVFQASSTAVYMIDQELPVPPGIRVTGWGSANSQGGPSTMATLCQVIGPAAAPGRNSGASKNLYCIMGATAFVDGLYDTPPYGNGKVRQFADTAIEIDHLCFDGQNGGGAGGGNTQGHAVVLFSLAAKVHDCYIVNAAQSGVVIADHNWAGQPSTDQTFEDRIINNTIINPANFGVWSTHTAGSLGTTDGYVTNNTIEAPSLGLASKPVLNVDRPFEAIRMDNAAGFWINGNRVSNCPGNAFYLNTTWGVHLLDNVVDGFGTQPVARSKYSCFNVTTAGAVKTHPGFITGNVATAYEGYNPYGAPAATSNFYAYFNVVQQVSDIPEEDVASWFTQSGNACFQASQRPGPLAPATFTAASKQVEVPNGSTAGVVQPGMVITASRNGILPNGTTVTAIATGSGSNPDTITLSQAALKSSTVAAVEFPKPTSIGWTYENYQPDCVLTVLRTNEVITGTIDPVPNILATSPIDLIDPADYTAGYKVGGTVSPGSAITYEANGSVDWDPMPDTNVLLGTAVFTESGTYTVPEGASALKVICVGGGGGGGGGGSTGSGAQSGGSGGAAGTTSTRIFSAGLVGGTSLAVTIGRGGPGGPGGASRASGTTGVGGRNTTVIGGVVSVCGCGGAGGKGANGASHATVPGAVYGGAPGAFTNQTIGGSGGSSSLAGGQPVLMSPGGGGGGGTSSASAGGGAGSGGSASAGGTAGSAGSESSAAGGTGAAASVAGAGGGGGGGATRSAVGGPGGAGASGIAYISVVNWD